MPRFECRQPGSRDVFGVHLRQRDERPAVVRPAHLLRQLRDRRLVRRDIARGRTNLGSIASAPSGALAYRSGRRKRGRRIDLQLDQPPHALQLSRNMNRARSIVPNRLLTIGKRQPFTRVKSSAGPPAAHDAPLNLGHFQPRVDFGIDAHELAVALEIVDTFAKRAIAHAKILTTEDTEGTEEDDEIADTVARIDRF